MRGYLGLGGWENGELSFMGSEFLFGLMKKFRKKIVGGCTIL